MTSNYQPEQFQNLAGLSGFNYTVAGTQPSEKGVAAAQRNTLRLWDQKGDPPWMGRGEIEVKDFSAQGYNHPAGPFSQNSNGFAWSEMFTARSGELSPTPFFGGTSLSLTGDLVGAHSAYVFNVQFLASGAAANAALFKETSATNPALTAVTYSPAASICSLSRTLSSGAERLAVGVVGNPVKFMSDAAGTVAATGGASTNSCWGIIMSGVNSDPTKAGTPQLLLYCGTTIGYISSDVAMTTAVTTTQTGLPAGGFAIGAVTPKGRTQRAYWAIPEISVTAGALKLGAEYFMRIYSTDMQGQDWLPLDVPYMPNGILGAVPFRDGILMHDGKAIVYWDGQEAFNLSIFRRRVKETQTTNVIDSDDRRYVRQLVVNGPECGAVWQWYDANAAQAGKATFELYNYESGTWHNAAAVKSLFPTGAAVSVVNGCGAHSISPNTGYCYYVTTGDIGAVQFFVARAGESLFWQNSLGSGGTYTTDIPTYANTRSLLGCRWALDETPPGALPGSASIARAPKVITEVEFNGDLDNGGAGLWTFTVLVQGRGIDGTSTLTAYDQTFSQGQPSNHYRRPNPLTALANIQDVQLYLTATSGSNRQTIPNLLPFTVRFAYIKDVPGAPASITEANFPR